MAVNPYADVFAPMATLLDNYAGIPSFWGAEHLAGNNAPPRYVWVVTGGPFDAPKQLGGVERLLGVVKMNVDVHCWGAAPRNTTAPVNVGADFDVAWSLVPDLITAARQLRGCTVEFGGCEVTTSEATKRGQVITVSMTVVIPLQEQDLDQPTYVAVKIENVAVVTDPAAVDPDDILQAPGT